MTETPMGTPTGTPTGGVRPMRESDLPAVMEVARDGLPRPWSEAIWREELASPFGLYLVLEEGGELRGFVGVQRIADDVHIMTLAVRPGLRRRGLGRALVWAALEDSSLADACRVHLEVRPSNAPARALYASLGFIESGVRKNYYGDEDALLMTLRLREGLRPSGASRVPSSPSPGVGGARRGPRRV